jgi:hypothetical protein
VTDGIEGNSDVSEEEIVAAGVNKSTGPTCAWTALTGIIIHIDNKDTNMNFIEFILHWPYGNVSTKPLIVYQLSFLKIPINCQVKLLAFISSVSNNVSLDFPHLGNESAM